MKNLFDKKDRFDLEKAIMDCWCVCDDLNTVLEAVLDREATTDQISNMLLGMTTLYHVKFEKLFETFEEVSCKN